ncbi:hypothetical protein [Streptomyces alanosinicus]|uniref:hypothetical protein n=1 Tax=Streptomyces alanosinicus TaxID=68171 RepID=UPI0016724218|nr:hypothetical protein [Streptomyces alanosinicus]
MRANSLPGRVVAIVSRRAPAFQPRPSEQTGLAWAVQAALPGTRRQEPTEVDSASEAGTLPGSRVDPPTDLVVTVEPWRWPQIRAASLSVGNDRSMKDMPTLVGLVAACLLAAGGFALTTLAPGEISAPAGPPPSSTATLGPTQTVERYFDAVNERDYRTAWSLGGRNFGESYDTFVAGFADTATTSVTVQSVTGDVVAVALNVHAMDGSTKSYHGTYTVRDGVITAGSLKAD